MQSIINFLSSIASGISNIFDIVITLVKDLVSIVMLLAKVPVYLPQFFEWIPAEIITAFGLILTIVIAYKIMGRD